RERITDVQQSAAGNANYQQWLAGTQLERQVSLEEDSVSNRGLRTGLVGTPERVRERVEELAAGGGGPPAPPVEPPARGDGALCRPGDRPPTGLSRERLVSETTGAKDAVTRQPIHPLLRERWSPRAFADRPVDRETLEALLEAARWAPS